MMKQIKQINLFIIFILVLFVFQIFKLPYSSYNVFKWDYENRMTQAYGYCEKESWGFYDYVINKFNLKNKSINIINDEGHVTLEFLFNINKSDKINSKYYIILNYQSTDNEIIFDSDDFKNLKNYKILHRHNNCYLLSDA